MEHRICQFAGCGKKLNRKNKRGYCGKHRHHSELSRQQDRARYTPERKDKVVAAAYALRQTPEGGAKLRAKEAVIRAAPGFKDKQANYSYKCLYGITRDEAETLLAFQGGRCALCFRELAGFGVGRVEGRLDHCHTTGVVRGVLCARCNPALGGFELVREAAVAYLDDTPWSRMQNALLVSQEGDIQLKLSFD